MQHLKEFVRSGTPSRRGAIALIAMTAVQLVWRSWAAAQGYMHDDDFWLQQLPHTISFKESVFWFREAGGHVQPLEQTINWVLGRYFPFDWAPRVAVMMIFLLATNAFLLLLLRRLWGFGRSTYLVYGLWVVSTLATPTYLWFNQSLNLAPIIACTIALTWLTVRCVQQPSGRAHIFLVLAYVIALGFSQLAITALFTAVGFAFLLLSGSPLRTTVPALARRARPAWLGLLAVTAVYIPVYLAVAGPRPAEDTAALSDRLRILGEGFFGAILPGILGGPWQMGGGDLPVASVGTPLRILAVVVIAGLLAASVLLRRDAWRPWLLLGLIAFLDVALLAWGRAGDVEYADAWRYYSALGVVAPLLITAAFVPTWSLSFSPASGQLPTALAVKLRSQPTLVVSFCALLLGGALWTNGEVVRHWRETASKPYFSNALADLRVTESPVLLDTRVPDNVVTPFIGDAGLVSRLFAVLTPRPLIDVPGNDRVYVFGGDGHLYLPLSSGEVSPPGKVPGCGYRVTGKQTIPLTKGLFAWQWLLTMKYVAPDDTMGVVALGDTVQEVEFLAGAHTLYVPVSGAPEKVEVTLSAPGATVCVQKVTVGKIAPDPARRAVQGNEERSEVRK